MNRRLGILLLVCVALSCGTKKKAAPAAPATRDFPMAEVPVMITEPHERAVWIAQHFWDRFTQPDKLYACDSLLVNGVPNEKLEQQVGLFASILQNLPLQDGMAAMETTYNRLEAFQKAQPKGNVFEKTSALIGRYFYDPNSPVRNEELFLPFVSKMAVSDLVPDSEKGQYVWDTRVCSLNRIGTPAADFRFVDTAGRNRTLYGIKAEWTLLIFGNPDCTACRQLMEDMGASVAISNLINSGRLKVVDVYIDDEIDLWKERRDSYPSAWINGYDPTFTIRTDRIYAVRAVPSLYLLDQDKNVALKDCPAELALQILETL